MCGARSDSALRPCDLGGFATAEMAMRAREASGASAKAPRLTPEQRVAIGSSCAWHWLTEEEAKTRGKAEPEIVGVWTLHGACHVIIVRSHRCSEWIQLAL